MSAPFFDGYTTWRWEVTRGSLTVAETTSIEAADAVERLYHAAYEERGERPCYGIGTHVARWQGSDGELDYGGHVTLAPPMTDGEVEAWFNKVAGARGCSYCGGKHASDRCLNVRQSDERRW